MSDLIQREINGLALSTIASFNDALRLRAATWFNLIQRLGVCIPFPIVHDLGLLWTLIRTNSSAHIGPRNSALDAIEANNTLRKQVQDVGALMTHLSKSDVVHRAQRWQLNDQVIAVLITKVLGNVYRQWSAHHKELVSRCELPMSSAQYDFDQRPFTTFTTADTNYFSSFFSALLERELQVRHAVEQLDLDTLRLLGLFQDDASAHSPLEMVDLLGLFSMPMVNDIVNFSLQIIPSVLETTKATDAQSASMDGFEGVERIGHIDNLMLSEFAYDDDIFFQKFLDNELFYFSRSRAREEEQKLHYIIVDASASMRGRRSVFARGVALAMIKKMLLTGERPLLRFFDSQLYQPIAIDAGFSVPYLLSFRSERGRNYRKVFEQLLFDIRRIKEKGRQEVILYILTHGQCHVPNDLMGRLRDVAYLFGVFILPGDPIEIDYLDTLHKSRLVQEDTLNSTSQRNRAAFDILGEI